MPTALSLTHSLCALCARLCVSVSIVDAIKSNHLAVSEFYYYYYYAKMAPKKRRKRRSETTQWKGAYGNDKVGAGCSSSTLGKCHSRFASRSDRRTANLLVVVAKKEATEADAIVVVQCRRSGTIELLAINKSNRKERGRKGGKGERMKHTSSHINYWRNLISPLAAVVLLLLVLLVLLVLVVFCDR